MINGNLYKDMIVSASNNLNNQKEKINSLNIFPVPDGDTGTNMGMTMLSAKKEIPSMTGPLGETAAKISMALLRGGRGNSGVILSLFFRGFAKALAGLSDAGCVEIANAFREGVNSAYKAVKIPTEGTILTVMRLTADRMDSLVSEGEKELKVLFSEAVKAAEEALLITPDLLPVLKQANVVDAGGKGFVVILEGMRSVVEGDGIIPSEEGESRGETKDSADFSSFETEDIKFGYCTECIVDKGPSCTPSAIDAVQSFINGIGNSVVFVDDDSFFKFHVHTNDPGKVLTECLKYGSLSMVKIENMKNQHSAMSIAEEPKSAAPEKKYGFVAVSAGDGIDSVFADLGVDKIVKGGQTMNPSTDDILKAVNLTPAEVVFVLTNNKNIYMAAKQTKDLVSDKQVVVLKSVSVPQGISAILAFNADVGVDQNKAAMREAMAAVKTASMTFAARNSTFDGNSIKEGQILGMLDGKVKYVTDTRESCMRSLASDISDKTMITLFYGEDVSEEEAGKMANILREAIPESEVDIISGGQPVYYYIISAE